LALVVQRDQLDASGSLADLAYGQFDWRIGNAERWLRRANAERQEQHQTQRAEIHASFSRA
jgi:hypothetical protein